MRYRVYRRIRRRHTNGLFEASDGTLVNTIHGDVPTVDCCIVARRLFGGTLRFHNLVVMSMRDGYQELGYLVGVDLKISISLRAFLNCARRIVPSQCCWHCCCGDAGAHAAACSARIRPSASA